uniref:Cell division control protein n=1 Tax=Electrophorus electricus TaxID=8005 RepID=A0A4W4GEM2_ELEEL
MPNTRSQSHPTLQFPKRKSFKTVSRSKRSPQPPENGVAVPLSPKMSTVEDVRDTPLSPRNPVLKSSSLSERIPLSPRKRTGDENACNLPTPLQGSPPKQSRPSPCSPRKISFNENTPVFNCPPQSSPTSPSTRSSPKCPRGSLSTDSSAPKEVPVTQRFAEQKSHYQSVKQVLHTAVPERLLSRESERAVIVSFLERHVVPGKPSSLYMSGAPGTGKTACLNCVLHERKALIAGVQTVVINCMTLRSSQSIFPLLAEKLGVSGGHGVGPLGKLLTSSGPTVLLVLDEMDQLDSKAQDVLYTIFEWPYLPKSRLCLIGECQMARPRCRPQLLHFPPYSHQELMAIVQDRLTQVSGEAVLDPAAVQFCARKVSAVSGDARKALDICRRAVEMAEASSRAKTPSESPANTRVSRVSIPQVARVLSEVYGDRMASGGGSEGENFPLQQKLLVCCLLLITRHGKSRDVQLGKLCEVYSRLCQQRQVGGVGQGECLSLCTLLESRGIFSLKKAKEARLTKISLKIEEKDVENALKDRTLLGSILAAGLP